MSHEIKLEITSHEYDSYKKEFMNQFDRAYIDCIRLGYGFVTIKRTKGCKGVISKHQPWLKIKECLEELGVIGAFGGKDHNGKYEKKAP